MGLRTFEFDAGDLPEDTTLTAGSYLAERRVLRFVLESGQWDQAPDGPVLSGNDASYWQLRREEAAKQGQSLGGAEADEAARVDPADAAAAAGPGEAVEQPLKPSGDAAMPTGLSRATSGPGDDGPEVRFASAAQTPVEEARQVEQQDQLQEDAHSVVRGVTAPKYDLPKPVEAPAGADVEAHSLEAEGEAEAEAPQVEMGPDDEKDQPRSSRSGRNR
jgi:hypothetical protein